MHQTALKGTGTILEGAVCDIGKLAIVIVRTAIYLATMELSIGFVSLNTMDVRRNIFTKTLIF